MRPEGWGPAGLDISAACAGWTGLRASSAPTLTLSVQSGSLKVPWCSGQQDAGPRPHSLPAPRPWSHGTVPITELPAQLGN